MHMERDIIPRIIMAKTCKRSTLSQQTPGETRPSSLLLIAWPCSYFASETGSANDSVCPHLVITGAATENSQYLQSVYSYLYSATCCWNKRSKKPVNILSINHVLIYFHFRSPFTFLYHFSIQTYI